jgi:ribosomal protein S18 acetylase RimI-like enzyme
MGDYRFTTIEGEPESKDKEVMVAGMLTYHESKGHPREVKSFSILIKDPLGKLVGCAMASVLWNGMEITSLWVDEAMRGQGLGQKLMESLEVEGKKRGCSFAYTNTFTWQAPEFYEKLGYTLYV